MACENKYINYPRNEQKDRVKLFLMQINVRMLSSVCNWVAGTGPQPQTTEKTGKCMRVVLKTLGNREQREEPQRRETDRQALLISADWWISRSQGKRTQRNLLLFWWSRQSQGPWGQCTPRISGVECSRVRSWRGSEWMTAGMDELQKGYQTLQGEFP